MHVTLRKPRWILVVTILLLPAILLCALIETAIAQLSKAQNDELFSYVRILEPASGNQIDALRAELSKTGWESAASKAMIRRVLARTSAKHGAKASDDAVISQATILRGVLEMLSDRPELCYQFMHPS